MPLVERVIARVCAKARLRPADAEDFASVARLHLIDNDYAVLRKHDPSSSLGAYLAVVLQRLLCDERNRTLGRWRPSAEARRMGDTGMLLEMLLVRDQRPLEEAVPIVGNVARELTPFDIEAMAARLPERTPRARPVELDDAIVAMTAADASADERVIEEERRRLAENMQQTLRETIAALPLEERMILKLRFGSSMSVADVARILQIPQRPLYRRIDELLDKLRSALRDAGIDGRSAMELIGSATVDLNTGLGDPT